MKKKSQPAKESASLHPNRILHPHSGDLMPPLVAAHPSIPGAPLPELVSDQERHVVLLECEAPGARAVFVAGNFNDWQPAATPMTRGRGGRWTATLLVPPGVHEYRFVVDGSWQDDPHAARSVPNPFGGRNSLLEVRPSPAQA
ncbi:MAG: hypothetical protein RJA22_2010 [Verrucomicrobiota bacterium]|jgi:5'-AMP-activated protein kinase regulatory beta subunit